MSDLVRLLIIKIENPLNYDVVILDKELEKQLENEGLSGPECEISRIDRDTLEERAPEIHKTFRVRLFGIINKENVKHDKKRKRHIKDEIIKWNNLSCGVYLCHIKKIDKFKRIIADMYEYSSTTSLSKKLIELYPDSFDVYNTQVPRRISR